MPLLKPHLIMRNIIAALALGAFTISATAQDENLVPNASFEDGDIKRLKTYGQLEDIQTLWFSANEAGIDLFAYDVKSEKVLAPGNLYGYEDPSDGLRYGGFRAYSKVAKLPRTYFEVRLTERLAQNQMYCVSFDISLSDMSKYAVNGIGAVLVDRKTEQGNLGSITGFDPQIHHRSDKVMQLMEGWETVCGTIIGGGQEEYLMIGDFAGNSDIEFTKMRRPKGFSGTQILHAYYYIDKVSVVPVDAKSQCACSKSESSAPDMVYGAPVMADGLSNNEVIGRMAVYYGFLKRTFTESGRIALNRLAENLVASPSMRLDIVGHCDNDEASESKINPRFADMGLKRAEQVSRYLSSQGVASGQLNVVTRENNDPASTKDSDLSRAKNRRVTFEVK
ncbi:MAG: OmpA family protein [Flavobacteriales bacterium]|nr:OmpA family protein [Flavobacteriales bacterium]